MSSIWFAGTIAESIAESKRKNVVFIVFARDGSAKSQEMEDTWNDPEIAEVVKDLVLIRVEQATVPFSQFTQFYPVMIVPSTYIIAPNGTPLEIIAGACSKEDLVSKIKLTKEKFAQQAELSKTEAPTSSSAQADKTLEEKTKYAEEKLEQIRQKKQAEARAAEIEAEKRRKSQMAELTRAKQDAEERQMKQIAEDRRREKEEDRLAREAIKQRIAQDRADKAARAAQQTGNVDPTVNVTTAPVISSATSPPPAFDGNVRIQLRFPDGTHETMTAPKETPLAQLNEDIKRDYASRIGHSDFSLAVPYPRRVFTQDEMDETLESLSLIPSTVLVVLPGRRGQPRNITSTAATSSGSSQQSSEGFIAKIIAMIVAFFTFLLSIFTGGSRSSENQVTSSPMVASGGLADSSGANSGQGGEGLGVRQRRLNRNENVKSGPESSGGGNVHRLKTDQDDDDDENNTWNGNSTQQM